MSTTKSMTTKLTVLIAAMAMALFLAVAPGQAFAAAGNQNEPDNIISVSQKDSAGNISAIGTVDLDAVYNAYHSDETQTALGGLFVQRGVVKVVKTDKYVTISDIKNYLEAQGSAMPWASGNTMEFNVWNTEKVMNQDTLEEETVWASEPELYTKNSTFTYDNMMTNCTAFHDADASGIDTNTTLATSEAVIALDSETFNITNSLLASTILGSSSYATVGYTSGADAGSYASPRLVWGYNSASTAGNRFPSNIDGIIVS